MFAWKHHISLCLVSLCVVLVTGPFVGCGYDGDPAGVFISTDSDGDWPSGDSTDDTTSTTGTSPSTNTSSGLTFEKRLSERVIHISTDYSLR